MTRVIRLKDFFPPGERLYMGRQNGERVRRLVGLDAADATGEEIEFAVPDDVFAVTQSFLNLLLQPSVEALGVERCREQYRFTGRLFDAPPALARDAAATSREAADLIAHRVATLRRAVLGAYRSAGAAGLTADECAERIRESVLAVRPRVTELYQGGLLVRTGARRTNSSGCRAYVLALASPGAGEGS